MVSTIPLYTWHGVLSIGHNDSYKRRTNDFGKIPCGLLGVALIKKTVVSRFYVLSNVLDMSKDSTNPSS